MTASREEWARAQAVALAHLQNERHVTAPISFAWYEHAPFFFGAWWTGGEAYVLVLDGVVRTARGLSALPPFFSALGVERLRAMTPEQVYRIVAALGAELRRPGLEGPWVHATSFPELNNMLREQDGVLAYIAHYLRRPIPIPFGAGPGGGSMRPGTPHYFERHGLQLHPVVADLAWTFEGIVEKPRG